MQFSAHMKPSSRPKESLQSTFMLNLCFNLSSVGYGIYFSVFIDTQVELIQHQSLCTMHSIYRTMKPKDNIGPCVQLLLTLSQKCGSYHTGLRKKKSIQDFSEYFCDCCHQICSMLLRVFSKFLMQFEFFCALLRKTT